MLCFQNLTCRQFFDTYAQCLACEVLFFYSTKSELNATLKHFANYLKHFKYLRPTTKDFATRSDSVRIQKNFVVLFHKSLKIHFINEKAKAHTNFQINKSGFLSHTQYSTILFRYQPRDQWESINITHSLNFTSTILISRYIFYYFSMEKPSRSCCIKPCMYWSSIVGNIASFC